MSTILLAPHGDDETLFAAYTCMRTRAHVIVCTHDRDPDVRATRSREVTSALTILGCSNHVWPISELELNPETAKLWLQGWDAPKGGFPPQQVYAPAIHPEGHEQHNLIGELAREVFGDRVVHYLTYAPRGQRQRDGEEVVPTSEEIARKLRALACYRTQIENPATRPWFFELLDLREWVSS